MSAADPYFTFPLAAFRYGNSPHDMLDALLCYGIVYAGLNTAAERFDDLYAQAVEKFNIKTLPANPIARDAPYWWALWSATS